MPPKIMRSPTARAHRALEATVVAGPHEGRERRLAALLEAPRERGRVRRLRRPFAAAAAPAPTRTGGGPESAGAIT